MVDEETETAVESMFAAIEKSAERGVDGLDAVQVESVKDLYI